MLSAGQGTKVLFKHLGRVEDVDMSAYTLEGEADRTPEIDPEKELGEARERLAEQEAEKARLQAEVAEKEAVLRVKADLEAQVEQGKLDLAALAATLAEREAASQAKEQQDQDKIGALENELQQMQAASKEPVAAKKGVAAKVSIAKKSPAQEQSPDQGKALEEAKAEIERLQAMLGPEGARLPESFDVTPRPRPAE
jgi:Fe-S cluster assembly scaffold protein SufB